METQMIIDERILRMELHQHRSLPTVDWSKVRIEKALAGGLELDISAQDKNIGFTK
jgi:hypothetical protein